MSIGEKSKNLFENVPIRIAILKFAWPSILMMFVVGTYNFFDSILAIHLADKNYEALAIGTPYTGKEFVRLFMSAANPIISFMIALSLLFGAGSGIRFSINLGAKRYEKALVSMRSGFMGMLFVAVIMTVVLLFTSKSWMGVLYEGVPGPLKAVIIDNGYIYAQAIIFALPFQMFNQSISNLLRAEGRLKEVAFAMTSPLFINLFLDWVFMGPAGMGVRGAAVATATAYGSSSVILTILLLRNKKSMIVFKNLFGFTKLSAYALLGIFLVGLAPFLRNVAQSIAGTFENREIGAISEKFTGDPVKLRVILAGVFPIFTMVFPLIFGFSQGGTPIASYNYGFGNLKRVREVYLWSIVYAFAFGAFTYALIAIPHLLGHSLLLLLGVGSNLMSESMRVLTIMLLSLPIFAVVIGAMTLFASTDRLLFSIVSNSLRGIIYFFPILYLFKYLTLNVVDSQDFFWWFYPTIVGISSLTTTGMAFIVLRHLDRKHETLDSRLERWSVKLAKLRSVAIAKLKDFYKKKRPGPNNNNKK